MRDKVLVIGSLNYDIIMKIPQMPKLGENMLASQVSFGAGGKGANQAVQAAKLGVKTYMAGCVGKDSMGDFLVNTMKKYGVNVDPYTPHGRLYGYGTGKFSGGRRRVRQYRKRGQL